MTTHDRLGGIIHTYQKYDPVNFPSPAAPPPDVVSPAFEHLLFYGNMRRLTEEELARAIRIDPRAIKGLGPSLDALIEILLERGQEPRAIIREDEAISIFFTLEQAQALTSAITLLVSSGRPVCPLCHTPLDGGPMPV